MLVDQRVRVARAQDGELAVGERHDLLDEIHTWQATARVDISAVADLTDSVVLKAGNAFLVTTPAGDVPLEGPHAFGLYRDDCRFVSGHELRVGGERPRLLVADDRSGTEAVHELTVGAALRVRVARALAVDGTLRERMHLRLYGREPIAAFEVEVALAADFRAGARPARHGRHAGAGDCRRAGRGRRAVRRAGLGRRRARGDRDGRSGTGGD